MAPNFEHSKGFLDDLIETAAGAIRPFSLSPPTAEELEVRAKNVACWESIASTNGWTFHPNSDESPIESAIAARNQGMPYGFDISDAQAAAYGPLNYELHDRITSAARKHFKDMPLPTEFESTEYDSEWLSEIGTPFTYQCTDWEGAWYRAQVAVLTDYISASFVAELQQQLSGKFLTFCIQVDAAEDPSFDSQEALYVFCDEVMIWENDVAIVSPPH